MKSSLLILTLLASAMLAFQATALAQYGQGPTMYGYPAARPVAPQMYYAAPGAMTYLAPNPTVYTAHVGDVASEGVQAAIADVDEGGYDEGGYDEGLYDKGLCDEGLYDKGGHGKGGSKCSCLACRRAKLAGRAFASLEYMHWYNKGRYLPPLASTSPPGTDFDDAGVLNNYPHPTPTARILFGNDSIGDGRQTAGRVTFGLWNECRDVALGGRIFGVEGHESMYSTQSFGLPILAVPFFNDGPGIVNPRNPAEDSLVIGHPGDPIRGIPRHSGTLNIDTNNEVFGSEIFLRYLVDSSRNYRMDVVTGYHFTRINDDLTIDATISRPGGLLDRIEDQFHASSEFHGGELGLLGEWYLCHWTVTALGKVSLGNMHQRVEIRGDSTLPFPTQGLFAQLTNVGVHQRDVTAVLPEANVKLSYALSEHLSMSVGYTLMYWNHVALAGDHIDRHVNIPRASGFDAGPFTPAFAWNDTDFWVQTVDIGVSWNY